MKRMIIAQAASILWVKNLIVMYAVRQNNIRTFKTEDRGQWRRNKKDESISFFMEVSLKAG